MERSPSAHSSDARDSRSSFRKPAIEASRRNYRRHSPSSSRSRSPSQGIAKWERSPSRYHEDGTFKRGKTNDTDGMKGRDDDRFKRATDVSLGYGSHGRDRRGRAEGYDDTASRHYSSHYDRGYQNSRSDHSRFDDGRYGKRTADRSTRERNAEDTGYRRREERNRDEILSDAKVPERDKIKEQETDVRDKHKNKEREVRRGQDRYGEKYRDDGSEIDAQQSRLGKRFNNGTGNKDAAALEGRDHDTDKLDGRDVLKNKADIERARDRESGRSGRDDGGDLESDKGEGNGRKNRGKGHKGHDEHRRGNKVHSSDELEDADELSQGISHNRSRKGDKDKKYSTEKGRQGCHEVGRSSDHLDEMKRSDDNCKGSKWGPEAGHSDPMAASSDPEVAKIAAMKAAALVNINLGGFKSVDEKRKMLWGSKDQGLSQKPVAAASGTNRWDTVQFADRDRQEKFNKLMGVKGGVGDEPGDPSTTFTTEKQEELQQDLEKQFTAGLRRRDGRTVGLGL